MKYVKHKQGHLKFWLSLNLFQCGDPTHVKAISI